MAEWLGRRTCNPEVTGSSPALSAPRQLRFLSLKSLFHTFVSFCLSGMPVNQLGVANCTDHNKQQLKLLDQPRTFHRYLTIVYLMYKLFFKHRIASLKKVVLTEVSSLVQAPLFISARFHFRIQLQISFSYNFSSSQQQFFCCVTFQKTATEETTRTVAK